jgi:adenosylcobinamide-phosphate synthase
LAVGFAADRFLGDPRRYHPVAGFGTIATALEQKVYADSRANGTAFVGALVGGVLVLGVVAERVGRDRPLVQLVATATATWAVLGGRSLEREATAVQRLLADGDLVGARDRLTHLVGRQTSDLASDEIARAVIESVAENTSDAVVAPLVWGCVAGIPGLLGYRSANTLDAMVGHRSARYLNFGWAAARFDDLLNLPGSRVTGLLVLAARPARARPAWRAWRRSAGAHPSPNAGVVEAAFAGSLGVRLGGRNVYGGDRVEHRVVMGDGRPTVSDDISDAVDLARRVGYGAAGFAAAAAMRSVRR